MCPRTSPPRSSPFPSCSSFTTLRPQSMPKTRNIRKSTTVAPPVKAAKEGTQTSSSKGRASPVKREAALIPFPTPPRTTHKRKRARSRVTDSDDDDDDPELQLPVPDGEDHESASKHDAQGALILGNKKRKTLDAIAEELSEAQEEAFWLGTSVPAAGSSKSPAVTRGRERSRSRTRSPSSSPPPAPHLLRRQHTGLASPPPSRRQPRNYVIRNVRATRTPPPAPAPVSPKLRTRKPGLFPMRDSPDNPFLADATSDAAGPSGSGRAHTPESLLEKPTMTWVLCVPYPNCFLYLPNPLTAAARKSNSPTRTTEAPVPRPTQMSKHRCCHPSTRITVLPRRSHRSCYSLMPAVVGASARTRPPPWNRALRRARGACPRPVSRLAHRRVPGHARRWIPTTRILSCQKGSHERSLLSRRRRKSTRRRCRPRWRTALRMHIDS